MPFGITEHLAASFSWWYVNKGYDKTGPYAGVPYDGNDPEYRDFYHDNYEHNDKNAPWLTREHSLPRLLASCGERNDRLP